MANPQKCEPNEQWLLQAIEVLGWFVPPQKLAGGAGNSSPLKLKTEHLEGVMILLSIPQSFWTLEPMKIIAKCLVFILNNLKILIMIKVQFLNKNSFVIDF